MDRQEDLKDFKEYRPILRTAIAFIIGLVRRDLDIDEAYTRADALLDRLQKDLEK